MLTYHLFFRYFVCLFPSHWNILVSLIQKQSPSNGECWFNLTSESNSCFRPGLDRPGSCLLHRTLFALSFTVSDVYSIAKKHTHFLSVRLKKKSVMFCWQRVQGKFFTLEKKVVIIPSRINAARPSWSWNNHGPSRGFIVWSAVHVLQCGGLFCIAA